LEERERQTLDEYDALFEKYSMFCNGRWLGAQVLQDSQDLMYLQHVTYMKKPDVIIETGTYKGGLTYFFASLLDWIDRESAAPSSPGAKPLRNTQVISVDRHHPDMVFSANWFCPVCADCIRPYTTDVWDRKVTFVQGLADSDDVYIRVAEHLYDLGYLRLIDRGSREAIPDTVGDQRELLTAAVAAAVEGKAIAVGAVHIDVAMDSNKTVVVNLDANHEFEGLMKELFFYAPLVSENSYLVVQDAKLDKIWGTKGPTAAVNYFMSLLPEGEFVAEPELQFHAYAQHIYLRRARNTIRHTYFMEIEQGMAKLIEIGSARF